MLSIFLESKSKDYFSLVFVAKKNNEQKESRNNISDPWSIHKKNELQLLQKLFMNELFCYPNFRKKL